jgi:peptidoglycan/LPS O-acetylase OafA/YrhL
VTPRKYEYIDALKGIAIVGVVLTHLVSEGMGPASYTLRQIWTNGARGVQLFFILSAFTLFLSLRAREGQDRHPLRDFYLRRFFRIAPLFYLAMICYPLLWGFLPNAWVPTDIRAWHVAATALFLSGWHPDSVLSVVPGGWVVAVEMNFYLAVPFLFRWVTSLRRALLLTVILLLADLWLSAAAERILQPYCATAHQSHVTRAFVTLFWLPAQLPVFGLGIVLYHLVVPVLDKPPSRTNGLASLAVSGLLLSSLLVEECVWLPPPVQAGIGLTCLAYGLARYPVVWLVNPVFRQLGVLSYGIFLSHFAVLGVPRRWWLGLLQSRPSVAVWLIPVLVLALSALVSLAAHKLVEAPGRRLGDRIMARLGGR